MTGATNVFLATIPSPPQGVWDLGPISLRAYALCIIAGIVIAIWWGEKRLVARGGRPGEVIDIAVWAVPFGLVGGRLYHVATDWYRYFGPGKNPVTALYVWEGGLGIWGAIALGAVGAWFGCRRKGIPLPVFADAVAPGIVVAQAVGRIGNYFNQELYGGPTTLPWGLEIYQRINPESGLPDPLSGVALDTTPIAIVHPTFLYELLWNLGVALLVVFLDRKLRLGHGRAFAVYVAGYTLGRTWIELMRTDEATHVFGVRINVWVSLLVFAGALYYFIAAGRKGEREDLAAIRGDVDGPLDDTEADADGKPAEDGEDGETGEPTAAVEATVDTDDGGKAAGGKSADEKAAAEKTADEKPGETKKDEAPATPRD